MLGTPALWLNRVDPCTQLLSRDKHTDIVRPGKRGEVPPVENDGILIRPRFRHMRKKGQLVQKSMGETHRIG
jgi:hypothetical protein